MSEYVLRDKLRRKKLRIQNLVDNYNACAEVILFDKPGQLKLIVSED